eukprot:gene10430-biopygen7726
MSRLSAELCGTMSCVQIAALVGGATRVMVIEDGMHERDSVLANVRAYARLVTPGSFLLVQDTKLDRIRYYASIGDELPLNDSSALYCYDRVLFA